MVLFTITGNNNDDDDDDHVVYARQHAAMYSVCNIVYARSVRLSYTFIVSSKWLHNSSHFITLFSRRPIILVLHASAIIAVF